MARVALACVVLLLGVTGAALATPGVGVLSAVVEARGTLLERLNIHSASGIKLKSKEPLDIVTQSISIAPGGSTGWHSHPGPVFVTIRAGALKIVYAKDRRDRFCAGNTYTAGQSFVDRGDENVHNAYSVGSVPAEFSATYLVPGAPGSAIRLDAPDPGRCAT